MSLIDSSESSNIYANELNYKQYQYNHSSYQLTQIFQQIGLPNVSLSNSGGSDAVFQLPVCSFNLSKSYLNFTLLPSAPGANNANWIFADNLSPIRQLQLYDDQGRYYCDLYDVGNYSQLFRYFLKAEDLITTDVCDGGYGTIVNGSIATVTPSSTGIFEGLQSSQLPATPIIYPQTNAGVTAPAYGTSLLTTFNQNIRPTGFSTILGGTTTNQCATNYLEPSYVIGANAASNAVSPCILYRIPLGRLKNTIFSLDKTLYIGRILYLRIVWQSTSKIGYVNVAANNLSTQHLNPGYSLGGNAAPSAIQNTPTAFSGAQPIYIGNMYLYLAKEQNIMVENALKEKIMNQGGLKVLVPWVSQFKQNIPQSTINNITLRITNALGKRLLKIYFSPYNANETVCYAYDHNILPTDANGQNIGAQASTIQKISTFYTLVNNVRTTQYNFNCNNGQYYNSDYDYKKSKLKGGCIFSSNEYYYNWYWCEDFCDNVCLADKPISGGDQDNFIDGIDISNNEVKYDIFATQGGNTGISVNMYIYICTLKELVITAEGITLI